jgi:hypothetical protein
MGRIEKSEHVGTAKNPRLLKACNITKLLCDMGEFFFISIIDEIELKVFYNAKKNNFLNELNFLL